MSFFSPPLLCLEKQVTTHLFYAIPSISLAYLATLQYNSHIQDA